MQLNKMTENKDLEELLKRESEKNNGSNNLHKIVDYIVNSQGNFSDETLSDKFYKYIEELNKEFSEIKSLEKNEIEKLNHILIDELDSHYSGIYISSLITLNKNNDFKLTLNKPINYLGYANTKNLTIDGDVGKFSFISMNNGEVLINGDCDEHLGYYFNGKNLIVKGYVITPCFPAMKKGKIVVERDLYRNQGIGTVCENMEGGILICNKDVYANIGEQMNGGEIIISGNVKGDIGESMKNGTIKVGGYVKGHAGYSMEGGIIDIKEYASKDLGYASIGGSITVGKKTFLQKIGFE
ncbi:hypothetical protein C0585_04045 [Candidatus Woesearchaeota archaeon]|nr:MAG: hypothetical protein C0585_04045 [Candidatus Woesearchaeota archaeon]